MFKRKKGNLQIVFPNVNLDTYTPDDMSMTFALRLEAPFREDEIGLKARDVLNNKIYEKVKNIDVLAEVTHTKDREKIELTKITEEKDFDMKKFGDYFNSILQILNELNQEEEMMKKVEEEKNILVEEEVTEEKKLEKAEEYIKMVKRTIEFYLIYEEHRKKTMREKIRNIFKKNTKAKHVECLDVMLDSEIMEIVIGKEDILLKNIVGNIDEVEGEVEEIETLEQVEKYGRNLTKLYKYDSPEILIGREEELKKLLENSIKRKKSSTLIVGRPGAGKTSLVETFASMIAKGKIPELKDTIVIELDINLLIGGTKYRGMLEGRLAQLFKVCEGQENRVILYIDEFKEVLAGGRNNGDDNKSNIINTIKKNITGNVTIIGATTYDEYNMYANESDKVNTDLAFLRRFTILDLDEISKEVVNQVVEEYIGVCEKYYKIKIENKNFTSAILKVLENRKRITSLVDAAKDFLETVFAKMKIRNLSLEEAFEMVCIEMHEKERKTNSRTNDNKTLGFNSISLDERERKRKKNEHLTEQEEDALKLLKKE